MTVELRENVNCPLCSKSNNCCNGQDKSLGICWCNNEVFPNAIFEHVPPDQLRKMCICKSCLERFKEHSNPEYGDEKPKV